MASKCPTCNGKGWAYQYIDMPILDFLGEKVSCPRCKGTGKYVSYEERLRGSVTKEI